MKRILAVVLVSVMMFSSTLISVNAAQMNFKDIGDLDETTQNRIQYLFDYGIMNGTGSNTFSPHENYTRAMFVTMLGRMLDVNPADYYYSPFYDVPAGRWDAPYVAWAAENGIVNGIGDGLFDPTGTITLEQYSAIIDRFWDRAGFVINYDSSIENWPPAIANLNEASSYARNSLSELVTVGLIQFQGEYYPNDLNSIKLYVEPKKKLTRAWIAYWFSVFHHILHGGSETISINNITDGNVIGTLDIWID